MGHKHRKSFIPVVLRSNGALTTSIDKVGAEFVYYYQNLLGTSSYVSSIDVAVVHSGHCLDESHYSFLLAPISNEISRKLSSALVMIKLPGIMVGREPLPGAS
jgi:hypothetical protein